jgi:hypothetical protein
MIVILWLAFLVQLVVCFIAVGHAIWDHQRIRLNIFRGNWGWLLFSLGFLSMALRRADTIYQYHLDIIPTTHQVGFNLINSVIFLIAIVLSERKAKAQYEDIVLMMDKCQKKAEHINNRLEKS